MVSSGSQFLTTSNQIQSKITGRWLFCSVKTKRKDTMRAPAKIKDAAEMEVLLALSERALFPIS